jgi:hypothetical protein
MPRNETSIEHSSGLPTKALRRNGGGGQNISLLTASIYISKQKHLRTHASAWILLVNMPTLCTPSTTIGTAYLQYVEVSPHIFHAISTYRQANAEFDVVHYRTPSGKAVRGIAIRALRDIEAGEEVLVDYHWQLCTITIDNVKAGRDTWGGLRLGKLCKCSDCAESRRLFKICSETNEAPCDIWKSGNFSG